MAENQTLTDALARAKIGILPQFNVGIIRGEGKQASQWFAGREFDVDGTTVQLAWFGDWARGKGFEQFWKSTDDTKLTPEARKKVKAEMEAQAEEFARIKRERHEAKAKEAEDMWDKSTPHGDHPYIARKKLNGLHGTRIHFVDKHPVILVPMRDIEGKLWNVTRIFTKKFEGTNSDKFVLGGGRKSGLFYLLGSIQDESTVYLAEGFATGCSIHEATGRSPTVICFDAGNLRPVAEALRGKFPRAKMVFCADDDKFKKNENGVVENAGKKSALEAASVVGGSVVLPRFTERQLESKPTDFNDLACLAGLKEVEEQLTNPAKQVQEVVPLFPKGKGKNARVSEKDVCENLVAYFGDRVTKHKQDLFIWKDNYWNHLDDDAMDKIKQLISKLAPDYGINDIERALRYFIMQTPSPPPGVNMFQPTPFAANFENGTLRVWRQGSGYRAEFGPHRREDYLTAKLPFDFPGIPGEPGYRGEVNAEFEAILGRVWEGDEDAQDKVRLYRQLLGACLIPLFPIIVLATGKPGSGKSTLLKIMRRLVSEENISTVDPSDFHGFLMEGMIGKLLNINTDIDLSTPMKDSMVKKIIDRIPVQVNRKNQKVVNTFLPAVHAYAGNGLPKTLDGESRAYERRMAILKTEKFTATGNYDREFDQWVWEQGPGGIICAAVEGLFDLLKSNGHYHVVESGKKLVKEMQNRNDPVAVFLAALNDGLLNDNTTHYRLATEGKIDRANLWELFSAWRQHEDRPTREMGRTHFYAAVEGKGHEVVTVKGIRKFKGIEAFEPDKANF